MLTVKNFNVQRERIDAFDSTQVDAVVSRPSARLMERVDAAMLAKIVFGGLGAKIVAPKRTVIGVDRKPRSWDEIRVHQRTLAGADRAVAAQSLFD